MKHLAAYMMLVAGGNEAPSAADVKGLLAEVGVEADDSSLNKLVSDMEGKDLKEVIAAGSDKLVKGGLGGGGGGGAAAGGGGGGDAAAAEAPKAVEEEVEEITGGTDMFGGGDDY